MLELKKISKKFKVGSEDVPIFKDLSLQFPTKGFVLVYGKSGTGKSTLLNIISGILSPDSGSVIWNGFNMTKLKLDERLHLLQNKFAIIFQDYNLFDNLTVHENLKIVNYTRKEDYDFIIKYLKIENLINKKIYNLSGGEKQRVAIARAYLQNSEILLCDEVTSSIGEQQSSQILDLLKEESKKKLVIVVSHDVALVSKYADFFLNLETLEQTNVVLNHEDSEKKVSICNYKLDKKVKYCFSFLHLLENKKKLLFSILLLVLTFFCFIGSNVLKTFSIPTLHANTMIEENKSRITFFKTGNFSTENIFYLQNNLSNPEKLQLGTSYRYNNTGNSFFHFEINSRFNREEIAYYNNYIFNYSFFEINHYTLPIGYELLGELPIKENEIVIPQYLADMILYHGILEGDQIIHFTTYEEIFASDCFHFNDISVKISGILKQNIQNYEKLKQISYEEAMNQYSHLYELFQYDILISCTHIYVSPQFKNLISKEISQSINSAYIFENDKKKMEDIFRKFPLTDSEITSETPYSESIRNLLKTINIVSILFKVVFCIAFILAILVLINYVENSYFAHRKEIMILKCLGFQNQCIATIYFLETLFITIFSWICSFIIAAICCFIGNQKVSKFLQFHFYPFTISFSSILIIIFTSICICYIICYFLIRKIGKMQPIDIMKDSIK